MNKDRYMNLVSLEKDVLKLISLHQEGSYWDFKKEWYNNKSDLLHDIICMANNLSSHDGLIIIGVDEETDYSICDITKDVNRRKTQDVVTFLRDKKFSGGIRPTVYVQPCYYNQKTIDVIIIRNDRNTPYFLKERYQSVCANSIYSRIMDTNTPINASADIDVIEKLWKKRFGIDTTALERASLFLQRPQEWVDSGNGKKFYKYAPEFTIEDISAQDGRDGYEYYLFNQCDSRPHWYDINIFYHQTLLYSLGGVALDGGRCFTSTPLTDGISLSKDSFHHWDICYKYFIQDSIEYIVHQFYITDDIDEELTARQKFLQCVLLFDSEFERSQFERFVVHNYDRYDIKMFSKELPYFPDLVGYNMEGFKKEYLHSLLLQNMLKDFRSKGDYIL